MPILTMCNKGLWILDYELSPVEFWPYATYVHDVVFSGPRNDFKNIEEELLKMFNEAGIKAFVENKCAYGVRDYKGRMWYLGFKDFTFNLGMSIESTDWKKPSIKGLNASHSRLD